MNNLINSYESAMLSTNPVYEISSREADVIMLQMGSLLSILLNKKSNQAKLLITTVEDKYFKELFLTLIEVDNLQLLVRMIMDRYPTVSRSKFVMSSLVKNKDEHK
jgi:hypothetical protein